MNFYTRIRGTNFSQIFYFLNNKRPPGSPAGFSFPWALIRCRSDRPAYGQQRPQERYIFTAEPLSGCQRDFLFPSIRILSQHKKPPQGSQGRYRQTAGSNRPPGRKSGISSIFYHFGHFFTIFWPVFCSWEPLIRNRSRIFHSRAIVAEKLWKSRVFFNVRFSQDIENQPHIVVRLKVV